MNQGEEEKVPIAGTGFQNPQNFYCNPTSFPNNQNATNFQPRAPQSNYGGVGFIEVTSVQFPVGQHKKPKRTLASTVIGVVAIVVGLIIIFALVSNHKRNMAQGRTQDAQIVLKASPSSEPSIGFEDIQIPQGRIRGYRKLSREGRNYTAFYKVPYAEAPLGPLRLKDPVPPKSWQGLRDNSEVAPQCIQKDKYSKEVLVVGEEDCLYANVYTPSLRTSQLLPVMVYVHGGGFVNGNGSRYSPIYFMDEDVVLVTFQFRLGAFGWLSTGDEVIRGNMGAKDQIQMLRWVQDNIAFFNGDPDLVTVFGNSAGGMLVGQLLLSPMSDGLFHRAISQSGASLILFDFIRNGPSEQTRIKTLNEVARKLNCNAEDSQRFLECLRTKPAEQIALVLEPPATYALTLENWEGPPEEKYMPPPISQRDLLQETGQRLMKVPYMIGNVNAEFYGAAASILESENQTKLINENFEDLGDEFFRGLNLSRKEMDSVKEFYFGQEEIKNDTISLRRIGDLASDRRSIHACYTAARHHAKFAKTFLYWISKSPYLSYIDKTSPGFPAKELGIVHHADELQYMFLYESYPYIGTGDEEYFRFSKMMVKIWVDFARTGEARIEGSGLEWPEVNSFDEGDATSTFWMELNDNPKVTTGPQQRMKFWDKFDNYKLRYDWEEL